MVLLFRVADCVSASSYSENLFAGYRLSLCKLIGKKFRNVFRLFNIDMLRAGVLLPTINMVCVRGR